MGITRRLPKTLRARLVAQGTWCQRCDVRHGETFHHLKPVSEGGRHEASNIERWCTACQTAHHAELDRARMT